MSDIENAKIMSTHLGPEDHGIFTASLLLTGPGWGQGFGNYNLKYSDHAYRFITGVLEAVGVDNWELLSGKLCRVKRDNGLIVAIGNVLENRWFEPRAVLQQGAGVVGT